MKSKNFLDDARKMSVAELSDRKRALKEELMKLRFKAAGGQLEKGHVVREIRRNIARVETIIRSQANKG